MRAGAVAILCALFVAGCGVRDAALDIDAVQHRGWWDVRYADGTITANEIHVPAGKRVRIHARLDGFGFVWFDGLRLPRCGRSTTITYDAKRGKRLTIYAAHARQPRTSELTVIADDHFDAWLAHEKTNAPAPSDRELAIGREIFLTARCTLCHSVRGAAQAELPAGGPDLTHVGSRNTIAAGRLRNRPGDLAGWIVDAETLKPGCGMPMNNIDSDQLQPLLAFMRTLR